MTQPIVIGNATLYLGDCLEILRTLPDSSVDSVVTDPPYGLSREPDMAEVLRHWLAGDDYVHRGRGFMGKDWDSFVPGPAVWRECLRVLKPGGHLLAFFGTRTQDIGTLAIRLAGFEIRDSIAWVYGSGFPKSLDVSKAVDATILHGGSSSRKIKKAIEGRPGDARTTGLLPNNGIMSGEMRGGSTNDNPATDAARRWEGWGTALKPALEPITMARKPLIGTVAANVLAHGTGALNIDGCRVAADDAQEGRVRHGGGVPGNGSSYELPDGGAPMPAGRWPANLIHDGSDEVLALFPHTKSGTLTPDMHVKPSSGWSGGSQADRVKTFFTANEGSAARFFYCAKASKRDRDEGLDEIEAKACGLRDSCRFNSGGRTLVNGEWVETGSEPRPKRNTHPTVKPTALMRYLCRLVTPPGGLVLDPFTGSGSTGKAAIAEGFRFVGIELSPEYAAIAEARIRVTQPGIPLEAA